MIDLEREEALAKMEPEKLERELQFLVQKLKSVVGPCEAGEKKCWTHNMRAMQRYTLVTLVNTLVISFQIPFSTNWRPLFFHTLT